MEVQSERVHRFEDLKKSGQFMLTSRAGTTAHTGLLAVCPCGCGEFCGISFDVPEAAGLHGPKWKWDGNEEAPTITPSIRRIDGCKWHGWLTAGVFKEA